MYLKSSYSHAVTCDNKLSHAHSAYDVLSHKVSLNSMAARLARGVGMHVRHPLECIGTRISDV
jgi:hypothetical protein